MSGFNFHTKETAKGEAKDLLTTVDKGYGFVPNLFGYMAEAPTTLKAYLQLNDLLGQTSFTGAQLQVALLAVSIENECHFCTVAHHAMSKKFKSNPQSIQALLDKIEIEDAADNLLAKTVVSVMRNKGWLPQEELKAFLAAGFTHQQYLELMLVITIKTLSNYINHQTLPEPNQELLDVIAG